MVLRCFRVQKRNLPHSHPQVTMGACWSVEVWLVQGGGARGPVVTQGRLFSQARLFAPASCDWSARPVEVFVGVNAWIGCVISRTQAQLPEVWHPRQHALDRLAITAEKTSNVAGAHGCHLKITEQNITWLHGVCWGCYDSPGRWREAVSPHVPSHTVR